MGKRPMWAGVEKVNNPQRSACQLRRLRGWAPETRRCS